MEIKLGYGNWTSRVSPWWILMLAALTQGCATMSGSECQNADWRTVGYEDGAKGTSASRVGKYREACAKHGISPDLNAYRQGREEGLRQFCRPQNGFRLGERGVGYAGVCPPDAEMDFLAAYEAGKRLHDITSSIRYTQSRLRSKQQQLARLKMDRQNRQAALVGAGLSAARRAELLVEAFELARDQGAVESEITELKVELERKRDTLADARATSPYR
jgi:hypothetical protein